MRLNNLELAPLRLVFYAVYILHKMWWETIPFYTFMNVPAQLLQVAACASFLFQTPALLYSPIQLPLIFLSRKPGYFPAKFDCRLSVLSRTADTCCRKIFLSEISKSVFSASPLPVLAANPVGRKIINLSVQEVSKGNK